jgi:hypothetical protein
MNEDGLPKEEKRLKTPPPEISIKNRASQRQGVPKQTNNKQSKHRAQSRPRPSANWHFDGSVGVFASLTAVMSPMRQLLAFVKRWLHR